MLDAYPHHALLSSNFSSTSSDSAHGEFAQLYCSPSPRTATIDRLDKDFPALTDPDVACGQSAIAAIARLSKNATSKLFDHAPLSTPINRREMERGIKKLGVQYSKINDWPEVGIVMLKWVGPWSHKKTTHAQLQKSHWVATITDYVYDVNWKGWLPKSIWIEAIVEDLLKHDSKATDWTVWTSFQFKV